LHLAGLRAEPYGLDLGGLGARSPEVLVLAPKDLRADVAPTKAGLALDLAGLALAGLALDLARS
ncbi:MAG: hypothetical protein RSA41_07510, partial [Christensenella sp.]